MASKRKPLDDARKRVKEKLTAIDEQKDFIQNSVEQITSGVKHAANSLLTESNKSKFFQKYRAVSQELEKCLDDLLLISATISSLEEEEGDESTGSEDDDKPPDDLHPTISCQEQGVVKNDSKDGQTKDLFSEPSIQFPRKDEKPSLISSSREMTKDLIDFDSCSSPERMSDNLSDFEKSHVDTSNHPLKSSPNLTENLQKSTTFSCQSMANTGQLCKDSESHESYKKLSSKAETSLVFDLVDIGELNDEKASSSDKPGLDLQKQYSDSNVLDTRNSTAFVNDLFMSTSPSVVVSEIQSAEPGSRRGSFVEEAGKILELNCENSESMKENESECSSPTTLRLQRIGFCEYMSQDTLENVETTKGIDTDGSEKHKTSEINKNIASQANQEKISMNKSDKTKVNVNNSIILTDTNKPEVPNEVTALPKTNEEQNLSGEQAITSNTRLQIPKFNIPEDKCLKVTVKEILSPKDFWIQKANDDLDLLMEKMCYHFSKRAKSGDKGGLKETPDIGHVCCARYTVDNVWYRALVTAVSDKDGHVTVLYIDEGNNESLPLSRLRELDEKFASLSRQTLRVQLRDVELSEDTELSEVNDWFKRRVSGETLEAVLYESEADGSPVPLDLYIRPHSRSPGDFEYQKLEYSIHEMLIRQGFAIRASSTQSTGTSDDVSPPSSPSDQLVKSESVVSSTETSGFHDASSSVFHVSSNDQLSPGCDNDDVRCRVPPPRIPVDSDGSVFMLVSHVVNPDEFYVHFISREAGMLDSLMTDMNEAYNGVKSLFSDDYTPNVGDFCCAKFSEDGNWYRSLVLQICCLTESGEKNVTAEVFYIDFGNIEKVDVKDLRELLPQFISIPAHVVRCCLADVNPSIEQESSSDVFDDMTSYEDTTKNAVKLPRQRSRKKKTTANEKAIVIAAGDEDSGDDIPDGDMDLLGLLPDVEKHDHRDRIRSSISNDIAKSYEEPSWFSDTAIELFKKTWLRGKEMSLRPSWSDNAAEYFKTLTLHGQKLVGYVVPWDSAMLNNIVNFSEGRKCSLPNLGPVLRLNLYDVSDESDLFINSAMVRAKYASSNSIKDEQVDIGSFNPAQPSCSELYHELDVPISSVEFPEKCEEFPGTQDVPVIRVREKDLSDVSESYQDSRSTPPPSEEITSPLSPVSPTSQLLDAWNPMSHDFQSIRNSYNVRTDNLDVAISGYEEDRGKICRFYLTKYGCYRGSKCPDKHIDQDVSDKVVIYGSISTRMKLPDIGAWVLVRITAIYDPSHFWVQLPFGVENLTDQIIKCRSGQETSGEDNLKEFNNMMKLMREFYSKTFRQKRSLVPPVEGELIVARSLVDNKWYRGQICIQEDNKYKILFVDYGITEWVERNNICPIVPQFLHLPFQSVECYLASIKPKSQNWTDNSRQYFKSLIKNKILICQILSTGKIEKTMLVNLFESDKNESQNIRKQLVKSGYANDSESVD